MEQDLALLRLQYEILNVPFATLAAQAGCPENILRAEADKGQWKQIWPENDLEVIRNRDDVDAEFDDDAFQSESELLLERSKRRLAIYNMAKEMLLSQRYLKLESDLIRRASDVVAGVEDTKDIRALASVFKDLTAKSLQSAMASLSFGQDEGGLPTVLIRDLSGK